MADYAIIHTATRIIRAVVDKPPALIQPDETLVRLNARLDLRLGIRLSPDGLSVTPPTPQQAADEAASAALQAAPFRAAQDAADAAAQGKDSDRNRLRGLRTRINNLAVDPALQTILRHIVGILESNQ